MAVNILLLSHIAGYVIALALAVCMSVSVSKTESDFSNHCPLFSTGNWNESNSQFVVDWASNGYCSYTIFVGGYLSMLAISHIIRFSKLAYRGEDHPLDLALWEAAGCFCAILMTFVAALFITLGSNKWCQSIVQKFASCELAAGENIDRADKIETSGFYVQMKVAEISAWCSIAIWMIIDFNVICVIRKHAHDNEESENSSRASSILNIASSSSSSSRLSLASSSSSSRPSSSDEERQTTSLINPLHGKELFD